MLHKTFDTMHSSYFQLKQHCPLLLPIGAGRLPIIVLMGPYLAKPITQKAKFQAESKKLKLGFARCEMQGWRRTMEDAAISELDLGDGNSLFAVFDGHGGPEVARFVERIFVKLLKSSKNYSEGKFANGLVDTFRKIDEIIESKEGEAELRAIRSKLQATSFNDGAVGTATGCTACVVLITPNKIITANAGDSRAVLCRKGQAVPLSFDHKPTNDAEFKRIIAAGGSILGGRINGSINLSRSLGDLAFKQQKNRAYDEQMVICKPEVSQVGRAEGEDEFIIVGCDGVWEKYSKNSQSMVDRLLQGRQQSSDDLGVLASLFDELLAGESSEERGCDNMSAILVRFL